MQIIRSHSGYTGIDTTIILLFILLIFSVFYILSPIFSIFSDGPIANGIFYPIGIKAYISFFIFVLITILTGLISLMLNKRVSEYIIYLGSWPYLAISLFLEDFINPFAIFLLPALLIFLNRKNLTKTNIFKNQLSSVLHLFKKRINRARFILGNLIIAIISILLFMIEQYLSKLLELSQNIYTTAILVFVASAYIALLVLPALILWQKLQIQRLHDLGRSGAWSLFISIPLFNILYLLLLALLEGEQQHNKYGITPSRN